MQKLQNETDASSLSQFNVCLSYLNDANKCRQCRQLSFAARGLELLLIVISHITVTEKGEQKIIILQLFYRILG